MSILSVVILTYLISPRSCAQDDIENEKMTYRKNVVNFKLSWCKMRMHRYDWRNVIGRCLQHMAWDAKPLNAKLQTEAHKSYVKEMDIRPAGFFSKIYIQSVSVKNVNKTTGGDSWRVNIRGPSNMAATVYDLSNGLYKAVFLPQEPGKYWAEIILDYTLCEGLKDPPLDWFIRGCRHGSFQHHGSLGNRTHDFLQEPLGGGKIEFSVPLAMRMMTKEMDGFKAVSQIACREKCKLLLDGFGAWADEQWRPHQTGLPMTLGRSGHQQGRGVLWVYGDSLNRYFFQSISKRPLCWQVFRACYHTMLWVYVLTQSAADEMSLMFGGRPISISRILNELRNVVTRFDMDQDSALILNAGVHLLKSTSFHNYQKIIDGFISVLKRYYRGTVIWKSTTAIHDQRELYSGCYRRFHTEQRVQLFNAYANWAMCKVGFIIMDVFPVSSSYPGGTVDGVHFKDFVFTPAADAVERFFQT
ncbi:uncharacterized protein [Montipora foliosa]|uniref:uncharacterized protein n=1 Tax=Montipora foliosa TaxID=591990 RepID=UPI0035F1A48E